MVPWLRQSYSKLVWIIPRPGRICVWLLGKVWTLGMGVGYLFALLLPVMLPRQAFAAAAVPWQLIAKAFTCQE